ncbi:hypothetical protein [Lactovum odontotermitis]
MKKRNFVKIVAGFVVLIAAMIGLSACSSSKTEAPAAGNYELEGMGIMNSFTFLDSEQYLEIKDGSNLAYHDDSESAKSLLGSEVDYSGTYNINDGHMTIVWEISLGGTYTYDYKRNWDGSFSLTADDGSKFDFKKK